MKKRQLAEKLGVSTRTIERLDPPKLRVGGHNRYLWSEVEAFLRGVPQEGAKVIPLRRPDDVA